MPDRAHRPSNTGRSPEVEVQFKFRVWGQSCVFCTLEPREIGSLLLQAYNDWTTDNGPRLGAALAYYTFFSLAPILIVVTGIGGLLVGQAAARGQIAPWLERLLSPEGVQAAELMLLQTATSTGGIVATVIGLVSLFLGTSALVSELRQALNITWRVSGPSESMTLITVLKGMVSDRVYAFVVVIGAGLLVMLSLMVTTALAAAGAYVQSSFQLPGLLLQTINFALNLGITAVMFTLIYKTVPDADVAWGDAWVGATVTAVLFSVGGTVFSVFLVKFSPSVYGTAASVLALLLWVYYSAQVFYFGAELTRIFANRYGGQIISRHRSLRDIFRRDGPRPSMAVIGDAARRSLRAS